MRNLLDEFKRLRTGEERRAWYQSLTGEEQQAIKLQVNAVASVVTTLLPEMEATLQHFRAMMAPWIHAAQSLDGDGQQGPQAPSEGEE